MIRLVLAMLATMAAASVSQAAVYNLVFDTDGDTSTAEGTGTITIDDNLIPSGGGKVLATQPGVSAVLNIGGLSYDTIIDVGNPSNVSTDTYLLLDAFGMIVDTDDECRVGPRQVLRWAGEA